MNNLSLFKIFLALGLIASTAGFSWAQAVLPEHILESFKHPWFWDVFFSSMAGFFIGSMKGFSSTTEWFKAYWSNAPAIVIVAFDFIIFVIGGAYFGTALFNPSNFSEALAAGLSWPIAFGALTHRTAAAIDIKSLADQISVMIDTNTPTGQTVANKQNEDCNEQ